MTGGVRSRLPQETVCGASPGAHWGVDSDRGCLSTHLLAAQVLSRYKTERLGRSSTLGVLARHLEKYRTLQLAWSEQRQAARLAVDEAEKEIALKRERIQQTIKETEEAVESYQQKLGAMYKGMSKELDDLTRAKVDKTNLLAESRQRLTEQREMVQKLEARNAALRSTLDKTMKRLNEVQTSCSLRSQENLGHEAMSDRRSEQAPEILRALSRVQNLKAANEGVVRDLEIREKEVLETRGDLERERAHCLRLEAFIRKIALGPAGSVRTGGGYILDAKAKREAAALIREASKLGAPDMHRQKEKEDQANMAFSWGGR